MAGTEACPRVTPVGRSAGANFLPPRASSALTPRRSPANPRDSASHRYTRWMPDRPLALIIRAAGTNCDSEMIRAFELAGARAELVHIDRLIAEPVHLERANLIGFPGGFSYGDDIASGRVLALKIRERLHDPLRACIQRDVPIIGVCNGFQVLAQTDLLPGPSAGRVALADNASARFIDQWIPVEFPPSACVWTRGLDSIPAREATLPIAHGEGRFIADDIVLDTLETRGLVAVRYMENPNGSMRSIAGICDETGLVFGLMPHPERAVNWRRRPSWTRLDRTNFQKPTAGFTMFRNAVLHTRTGAAVRSRDESISE